MQSTRDTSSGHQLKPFLAIIIIVILAPNSYCQWPTYTADLLISKTSGIETMEKDSIASYKVTFEGKPNPSAQILTASIEVICSEGQRLLKVRYPHTTAETIVTQNRIGTYMISSKDKSNEYLLRKYESNSETSVDDKNVKKSLARLLPALLPFSGLPSISWKDYFEAHPPIIISQKTLPDGRLELQCKFGNFSEGNIILYKPELPIVAESSLSLLAASKASGYIINTRRNLLSTEKQHLISNYFEEIVIDKNSKQIAGYSKYTYMDHSFVKSDDSVFDPANYRIPEQEGAKPTILSTSILWLAIASCSLAVFFVCGWLLKRRAKARAAATLSATAPITPAKPG